MIKLFSIFLALFLLNSQSMAATEQSPDKPKQTQQKSSKKVVKKSTTQSKKTIKNTTSKPKGIVTTSNKTVNLNNKNISHPNITNYEVNNYISGFRDIKFGSYSNDLTNRVELDNSGEIRCYKKSNENLKFYGTDLELIVYCYNQNNKLFLIELISKNENSQAVKNNFEKYIRNFQPINENQSVILQYKDDNLERAILSADRNEELKSFFIIDFTLSKNIYSF